MMTSDLMSKLNLLKENVRNYGSVAVAFSGGVDSALLLKISHDVLGDQAIAVTANACSFSKRELEESIAFCKNENIRQIIIDIDVLSIEGFVNNPVNRCYWCKKHIFSKIIQIARDNNLRFVLEGSNMDDTQDYRPGFLAITDLGVKSPLHDVQLYKSEIRWLSNEYKLPTSDKPSFACLATRFVYGETITEEKLGMVDKAEQLLFDLGFKQFRVRIHDKMARIEILPDEFDKLIQSRNEIVSRFKSFGFSYISLDLQGYRTGSMNVF